MANKRQPLRGRHREVSLRRQGRRQGSARQIPRQMQQQMLRFEHQMHEQSNQLQQMFAQQSHAFQQMFDQLSENQRIIAEHQQLLQQQPENQHIRASQEDIKRKAAIAGKQHNVWATPPMHKYERSEREFEVDTETIHSMEAMVAKYKKMLDTGKRAKFVIRGSESRILKAVSWLVSNVIFLDFLKGKGSSLSQKGDRIVPEKDSSFNASQAIFGKHWEFETNLSPEERQKAIDNLKILEANLEHYKTDRTQYDAFSNIWSDYARVDDWESAQNIMQRFKLYRQELKIAGEIRDAYIQHRKINFSNVNKIPSFQELHSYYEFLLQEYPFTNELAELRSGAEVWRQRKPVREEEALRPAA